VCARGVSRDWLSRVVTVWGSGNCAGGGGTKVSQKIELARGTTTKCQNG